MMSERKQLWHIGIFFAILLLAAGVRIVRYMQLDYQPNDSYGYCYVAEQIAARGWRGAVELRPDDKNGLNEVLNKPPLLVGVMSMAVRGGMDAQSAGIGFNFLCGMLCVAALGGIARVLFGDWRYGLGAMLLAAVMPVLVRYSCVILREMPYWCASCTALWAAVYAVKHRQCRYGWALFGVFAGVAILARKEGVELVGAFGIYWLLFDWRGANWRETLWRKMGMIAAAAVPLGLMLLPIQIYLNGCGWNWQCIPWERFVFYFLR